MNELQNQRAELMARLAKMDADIANIEAQLDRANQYGGYEPRWHADASVARRQLSRERVGLQHQLGAVTRRIRGIEAKSFSMRFVGVAQLTLPPEVFAELQTRAQASA
jgi:hypothetical protein